MNAIRERITRIRMTDQGCNAARLQPRYRSPRSTAAANQHLYPALAIPSRSAATEVEVEHEERAPATRIFALQPHPAHFDLVTGFSAMPLQLFSLSGIAIALLSLAFVIFLAIRPRGVGPRPRACLRLRHRILLIGITLFGIGLLANTWAASTKQVRQRPALHRAGPFWNARTLFRRFEAASSIVTGTKRDERGWCFAYHDVGCRCLRVLLDERIEVPLV